MDSGEIVANEETRVIDRLEGVVVGNDGQVNILNLLKSLIELDLTGTTFRREVAESLTVEDFTHPGIQRNNDMYRCIRLVLHDVGLETASHAAYASEPLIKRIIRTL